MSKRRKILIASLGAVLILVFSLIGFLRSQYVVPIIMYHSVSPQASLRNRLTVSVDTFERQMRFLKTHRYNVLTLESLAELIAKKERIPSKTIAITFDDGYRDNYLYAFPVLKKCSLPATIFIIINEVGRLAGDRLTWSEIKLMQDSGLVIFGSHALGPEPLVKIASPEELRRQIFDSKRILEEQLNRKVNAFSYPEGRFNPEVRQLVIDAGYKLAVATNPGRNFSNNDIFALKRLRISESSRNLFIFWIETSGYYNFLREHRHK